MHTRGLLDETLVVVMGEFGRTPKIGQVTSGAGAAKNNGRDHWPYCYTVLFAGAGMPGGAVYGSSDKTAAYPRENPVTPRGHRRDDLHRPRHRPRPRTPRRPGQAVHALHRQADRGAGGVGRWRACWAVSTPPAAFVAGEGRPTSIVILTSQIIPEDVRADLPPLAGSRLLVEAEVDAAVDRGRRRCRR